MELNEAEAVTASWNAASRIRLNHDRRMPIGPALNRTLYDGTRGRFAAVQLIQESGIAFPKGPLARCGNGRLG